MDRFLLPYYNHPPLQDNNTINLLQLHQKQLNQTLLQPPGKCGHYGQACRTHHSTEPSYDPPLHHHHPAPFLTPPPQPRPSSLVDPLHLVLQVILQATRVFFLALQRLLSTSLALRSEETSDCRKATWCIIAIYGC